MALDSLHLTDGSLVTYYQEIKGKKKVRDSCTHGKILVQAIYIVLFTKLPEI